MLLRLLNVIVVNENEMIENETGNNAKRILKS